MGPRDRLVEAAIDLVRERGVPGAGLADLLTRGRAARNSVYQHFPGGKAELVACATEVAGARMTEMITALLAERSPADAVSALIGWWREQLTRGDFRAGCPVLAAGLAEFDAPGARDAAANAFEAWTEVLARALDGDRALAGTVISAVEGAIARARAVRSTHPLDEVESVLARLL